MIFPELKNKSFGYVNLNLESQKWILENKPDKEANPLLNPEVCQQMIEDIHKKYGLDFSYGGWMEDRSFLLRGSYLDQNQNYLHLGVDFNVPAKTKVAADFNAKVLKIDDDYPEEGGWGPRVIMKHQSKPICLIYAHLDRDIKCRIGDVLQAGQVFASVGKAPFNGNWFPHLHIQTIEFDYYKKLEESGRLRELDGYGAEKKIEENARLFRDPMEYVFVG